MCNMFPIIISAGLCRLCKKGRGPQELSKLDYHCAIDKNALDSTNDSSKMALGVTLLLLDFLGTS